MPETCEPATPKEVVKQQIQDVKEAEDLFTPMHILPVAINFRNSDPYELSQEVVYDNGIVRVVMEKGFRWDGASIPPWIPVVPWMLTVIAVLYWPSPWLLAVTALLVMYTIRLLPYLQKMGRHSRAGCTHDKLYRAQKIARVVADAIMLSIMETDGVPWDVRTIIYRRVRHWGWLAWNKNKRALRAKAAAAQQVEVNPLSAVAPDKVEKP